MLEPATTITDYLLAVQCTWIAWALTRRLAPSLRRSAFVAVFASVAAAAIFGGTVHGFLPDENAAASRFLWTTTMLSIGVTAGAMLLVGIELSSGERSARRRLPVVVGALVGYSLVIVFVRQEFWVAIAAYLPAALYLLAVFLRMRLRDGSAAAGVGAAGIGVTLVGAVVQQAGVAVHPVHFDHNAVYHVIQGLALYLLFRSALGVAGPHGLRGDTH